MITTDGDPGLVSTAAPSSTDSAGDCSTSLKSTKSPNPGGAPQTLAAEKIPLQAAVDAESEDGGEAYVGYTQAVSKSDFFKREQVLRSNAHVYRSSSPEDLHWSLQRRWSVRLHDVRVKNLAGKDMAEQPFFLRFVVGGYTQEYKVSEHGSEKSAFAIWVMGEHGTERFTPTIEYPQDGSVATADFDCYFTWYGSYDDLRREKMRIEAWNWYRWGPNKLDCWATVPLISIADGSVYNVTDLEKLDKFGQGTSQRRCEYAAFFQEVYDFELSIPACSAKGLLTGEEAIEKLAAADASKKEVNYAIESRELEGSHSVDDEERVKTKINVYTPVLNVLNLDKAKKLSSKSAHGRYPDWKPSGKVTLRGTVGEFNRAALRIDILGKVTDRSLFPTEARVKGFCSCLKEEFLKIFQVLLPLKNVLDTGFVEEPIAAASWVYRVTGGRHARKIDYGDFTGSIQVPNRPRYQQVATDLQEEDFDYKTKRYLMVKVVKVDKVVTPPHDMRPVSEIDTFVEVTFDGIKKSTRTVHDQITPVFDDVLVWELRLVTRPEEDEEAMWEEISDMGPLRFDFWTEGTLQREHLGHCKAFTSEILVDERGVPNKMHAETVHDEVLQVRKAICSKPLTFIWGTGVASNLYFEMWFLRDLSPLAKLKQQDIQSRLPEGFRLRFTRMLTSWHEKTRPLEAKGRRFPVTIRSQNKPPGEEEFFPRMLGSVRPPVGINTPEAVSRYIGCFPYKEHPMKDRMAYTPDFFCAIRAGDILDHALLHASFLLGLAHDAYVCLGSRRDGSQHAWVATLHEDEDIVRFWEPFLGASHASGPNVFVMHGCFGAALAADNVSDASGLSTRRQQVMEQLRRKSASVIGRARSKPLKKHRRDTETLFWPVTTADGMRTALPYRDVDVVFNNKNIWANLQRPDPRRAMWNLSDSACWYAFAERIDGLRPCFKGCHLPRNIKDEVELLAIEGGLRRSLCAEISSERNTYRLRSSFVVNSLMNRFLDLGLRFREQLHAACERDSAATDRKTNIGAPPTAPILRKNLEAWEDALARKSPEGCGTSVSWLFFNVLEAKHVASQAAKLSSSVHDRSTGMQFAAAAHVLPLPGGLFAVYVCIVQMHKVAGLLPGESVSTDEESERGLPLRPRLTSMGLASDDMQAYAANDAKPGHGLEPGDDLEPGEDLKPGRGNAPPLKPGRKNHADVKPDADAVPPAPPQRAVAEYVFSKTKIGKCVQLCANSTSAFQRGDPGDLDGGVIIEPAIARGHRGYYFEVRVEQVRQRDDLLEGMAIGVTTRGPSDLEGMPETPDLINPAWVAGYAGWQWNGNTSTWDQGRWYPVKLQEGDHVGVLVTLDGALRILVNGSCVERCDFGIPVDGQLFGVACVLGSTSGISLVPGALPPEDFELQGRGTTRPPPSAPLPPVKLPDKRRLPSTPMRTFHPTARGRYVEVSGDGLTARNTAAGDQLGGGLLGDGVMPRVQGGLFFELRIDEVDGNYPDGLAVGVTSASPSQRGELPETLDLLQTSWLMGFDGGAWDGAAGVFSSCRFQPQLLKAGDRLGVFVKMPSGVLSVTINGGDRIEGPHGIPVKDTSLYAVVDLLGSTRQVTLVPGALPFQPPADPGAVALHPSVKGKHIQLMQNRCGAKRADDVASDAAVMGELPLKFLDSGTRCFEARVDALDGSWRNAAFALGVTTANPSDLKKMPVHADDVSTSWLVGYDGAVWNGGKREWQLCDWDAGGLKVGDMVRITISRSGTMTIRVNGQGQPGGCKGIPAVPLYPLVDVLAPVSAVTLVGDSDPVLGNKDPAVAEGPLKFHATARGKSISFDGDGSRARRVIDGASGSAVLLSERELKPGKDGVSFEVTVTNVEQGYADGLAIGVTTTPPQSLGSAVPDTADGVEHSWLLGFDGAAWDGPQCRWTISSWLPRDLRVGDGVRVEVSRRGVLVVYVNGTVVAEHPGHVRSKPQLYALMDLVGVTTGIAFKAGGDTGTTRTKAVRDAPHDAAPPKAMRDVPHDEDDGKLVLSSDEGISGPSFGFSRSRQGRHVKVFSGGRHVSRDALAGGATGGGGAVFGREALVPLQQGGVYFSVTIKQVRNRPKETEGMFAIGVTAEDPIGLKDVPDIVDDLPTVWLVGFNGATLETGSPPGKLTWGVCDWDTSTLQEGDVLKVRVACSPSSKRKAVIKIFVNGVQLASCTMHIPTIRPLFPLVDLDGRVLALSALSSGVDHQDPAENQAAAAKRTTSRTKKRRRAGPGGKKPGPTTCGK